MVQKLRLANAAKLSKKIAQSAASSRGGASVEVEVKRNPIFDPLYNRSPETSLIICIGGRGGGKTYEVSKWLAFETTIRGKRAVITRDEKTLVKESILNEVLLRYDTADATGILSQFYERLETGIKNRSTGEMSVFTKGFRASSSDKKANTKSVSNVDIAVIEEAEDIKDEHTFNTFSDSVRNEGSVVVVILNTPDVDHWLIKRYFNTVPVEFEIGGKKEVYYRIEPKKMKGFEAIIVNYDQNPYLQDKTREKYDSYGDPESPFYDPHYYYTAILGYSSTGRRGQVLRNVRAIKLADYLELPYQETYGQDFGTASPAGLIGMKKHRNRLYVRQLNYKPMTALELGRLYCTLGFTIADTIIGDNADKDTITRLRRGWTPDELSESDLEHYPGLVSGFNVIKCHKDDIENSLALLTGYEIYVVEESLDYWEEVRKYVYATDKNGNLTNKPIDEYNHLIDPTRYTLTYLLNPYASSSTAGERAE